MTAKRFQFHNNDKISMIYDKENERYYFCIDLNKVCDLLNDLHQEAKDNEHYHTVVLELYKAVSKENEQLKKEILWWKYRCGEDISGDVE